MQYGSTSNSSFVLFRGRPGILLVGLAVALASLVLAGCSAAPGSSAASATRPPATVTLLTTQGDPGTYLTDGTGRALYMWDADRGGTSTCYGDCAVDWPPLTVQDEATAGDGVESTLIGYVTREDGTKQVTYGGWPLYYFKTDIAPGQLAGQGDTGYGAVWWVISPSGNPLPSPAG